MPVRAIHQDVGPPECGRGGIGEPDGRGAVTLFGNSALDRDLVSGVALVGHDAQDEGTVELGRRIVERDAVRLGRVAPADLGKRPANVE